MTPLMKWTGVVATLFLVAIIPFYAIVEPVRQQRVEDEFTARAVTEATDVYAENCAVCHGGAGEGIGEMPALDSEALRTMTETDLSRVIARGRDNTVMAAWAVDEGGILTSAQVTDMVTFIQSADWVTVEQRVADLGLTPPEPVQLELTEDILTTVASLAEGETMVEGLTLYAENCAACHGGQGEGTTLAPAIDSAELRATDPLEIARVIEYGSPGTLMAGWSNALDAAQIDSLVTLINRWPELQQAGVEFPEVPVATLEITPEMIADGQALFNVACKSCHGLDGYGTPMAPALNNQTFLSETPDAAIYQIIANGVPETMMPAWGGRLDEARINSLVAFLRSLEETAPPVATER